MCELAPASSAGRCICIFALKATEPFDELPLMMMLLMIAPLTRLTDQRW